MLDKMTVRAKVTLDSFIVAGLFAFLCGSALLATGYNRNLLVAIGQSHDNMTQSAIPLMRSATSMQLDVTQVQQFFQDISATRGMDGLSSGLIQAEQASKSFKSNLAVAKTLAEKLNAPRLNDALASIESSFEPYYQHGHLMAQAYIDEGPSGGNPMMRDFDEYADKLRAGLNRVVDIADEVVLSTGQATHRTIAAMQSTINAELLFTLTLAAIAFVMTGAIAVTMRNSVSLPIQKLGGVMTAIVEGELSTPVPLTATQNEIGEMARAVDVFRRDAIERQRLAHETKVMSQFNDWLQSAKSEQELYCMISDVMGKLIPGCTGTLFIYANSRDVLECVKVWNGMSATNNMHPDDCWGLRRGRTYTHMLEESEIHFHCQHHVSTDPGEYCCIPILAHGETVGLLHLQRRTDNACHTSRNAFKEDRRLGLACAEQISLAIANIKLREQLRDQSIRDPLTGLYNRRYMLETCGREFARARRDGQSVSVLSIDVDHFKRFNDNHGHDAGDTVLRVLGECLRSSFREDDVPCRFGGEEFSVVLPGCSLENGVLRAEEFRTRVEALVVRYADGNLPRISVSIGVAAFPEGGENPLGVMKMADDALYAAKEAGRNCVRAKGHGYGRFGSESGPAAADVLQEDAVAVRAVA